METEVIKYKLQKFFEGESSLEDEQILHNYFRSDLVDPQLLMYRTLFTGLEKMTKTEPHASGERLMDFIIEYEQREKIRYRRFWQIVTAMAAALLIALLATPFNRGLYLVGEALNIPPDLDAEGMEQWRLVLETALNDLTHEADRRMGRPRIEPAAPGSGKAYR